MVEAGADQFAAHPRQAMRKRAGAQQRVVAGIGDHRAVQRRVLFDRGQRGDSAKPAVRARFAWFAVHPVQPVDRAHVDRAGAQDEIALLLGHAVARTLDHLVAHLHIALQFFGRRDIGHGHIVMRQPVFGPLEAGGEVEDRSRRATIVGLAGDHAAVGEAAPVEVACGVVGDVDAFLAAAQEIGVERVCLEAVRRACLRRLQRLRDDLPAEYAAHAIGLFEAAKGVLGIAGNGQQADKGCDELFWCLFNAHAQRFAGALRLRQASRARDCRKA